MSAVGLILLGLLRRAPSWVIAGGIVVLLYEGFPPPPLDRVPFVGGTWSLFDGRVDRVRARADERCRLQKIESQRLAERADRIIETEAERRRAEQAQEAAGRLAAALAEKESYERDLDEMAGDLKACRRAGAADVRRLR